MTTRVTTDKVRLSFPELFEAKAKGDRGEKKFSTMILIPKSDKATLRDLRAAEKQAAEDGKNTKFGGKIPKFDSVIHDGDEDADLEAYPERAGHWYMSVSSNEKYRPQVVDREVQPILDQSEVYSGVFAKVSVNAYAFNFEGKKGVTFGLGNVQILGGGEPFAGGPKATDDFTVEEAADDEDLI